MISVLVEPIPPRWVCWIAAQVAGSITIGNIAHYRVSLACRCWRIPLILALCASTFFTFIAENERSCRFDLAEAEQELQEGPLTEYSLCRAALRCW